MDNLIVLIVVVGSIGLSLMFVGGLFALLTAFGNKQYAFGIVMLLFLPASLVYCALHWKLASHPGKLLYAGTALLAIAAVCLLGIGGNPYAS